MDFRGVKQSVLERLGYGKGPRYQQLDSLGGAFDVLKTKGGRLRQRIIAGTIISCTLVLLYLAFSPSESLESLRQDSISKWWKSGDNNDASIEDSIWQTQQNTCDNIPDTIQVSILETVGAHDEVDAALVHSLASQPNVNLTLYQKRPRFGSEKIIQAFDLDFSGPYHPDTFMAAGNESALPDVLVLTTCELGLRQAPKRLEILLNHGQTRLICVVHHADQWAQKKIKDGIRPWVDASKVEFWTLSPHTADFLTNVTSKWEDLPETPTIRVFVPVFPVPAPEDMDAAKHDLSFAMQGDYDPHRRDYAHIFQRLGTFLAETQQNVSMHLLGQGNRPSVPENIKKHVFFDQGLSYTDFYAVLSRVSALLPGFASSEYLDRKASSSVPAALIAGTPLVASQEVLDAYSYVNEDSVWLQKEGETEFDVVGRILGASKETRRQKSVNARRNCEDIVKKNGEKVAVWIKEAVFGLYCTE